MEYRRGRMTQEYRKPWGSATFEAPSQANPLIHSGASMQSRYIAGLCAAVLSVGLTGSRADQPLNVRLGWRPIQKLIR